MEFSKCIFSYCDYVVVLDLKPMDITWISWWYLKGITWYRRVLDAVNYYKSSQVANLTPSNPTP
jgi:hypothetical protein